jgi:PD-(D/E)XK nuclease superfamily
MTDYERLESFFSGREWYDYSRLRLIDACARKGFYALVGPGGTAIDTKVGPGANFGTCFHAGLAAYYAGWNAMPEHARRLMAARTFADTYSKFRFDKRGVVPRNHSLARGLTILDAYFDHYLVEDPLLKPLEAELGFAVEMGPRKGEEDFETFIYVGSVDGIFDRSYDGRRLPRETKTTRSDAMGRLRQLNFNHQPVGYVTSLRNFPGCESIDSFIGDTVLIAAEKLDFARDYFTTNEIQREMWRRQVINKVEAWRRMKRAAAGKTVNEQLTIFVQNTEDCFSYGKCAFYDLCDFGISPASLAEFEPNTWNPLLRFPPEKTLIAAEGQIDSITIKR